MPWDLWVIVVVAGAVIAWIAVGSTVEFVQNERTHRAIQRERKQLMEGSMGKIFEVFHHDNGVTIQPEDGLPVYIPARADQPRRWPHLRRPAARGWSDPCPCRQTEPEKASDYAMFGLPAWMLACNCDRTTCPQVFLNTTRIVGPGVNQGTTVVVYSEGV